MTSTAALATGATRLCRCFLVIRQDGTRLGFTDHDADLAFGGDTYRAGAALSASDAQAQLGLAPDELDASGALSADAITEADLAAGRYDGAEVFLYEVDWGDPETRALLGRYVIGQVERGPLAFRAELRSLAAALDTKQGRAHTRACDVRRLGDARCKVNLGPWQATATVVAVAPLEVTVSGLSAFAPTLWVGGTLDWLTGGNAGTGGDIRAGIAAGGGLTKVSLWRAPGVAPEPGDTATATVGCDRTWATCRDRFGNGANFRGFPHMPGEGFAAEYGLPSIENQDGGSRYG
jgi:uncharacterized phage protein (TIGR02218 family)